VEYASLGQSVIQLTKIVSEGMNHVKKVLDAPNIAGEANTSAEVSLEEQIYDVGSRLQARRICPVPCVERSGDRLDQSGSF
jgi:hypothetical protein